ncbi:MAG: hypothetical protein BTN85_2204 [Candidatus Methanohalarchaeum thermophilum]|uniref:Uncharacterized protein n=1 Tax=Methanohalarchaeum thermophilum TaxID=1903181 RepID=A0A1Q6DRX6_METT1|nr:MAG: hypothetical protein BTN85_2204 [Candidatus Methanohalarchaeum thermophilum]
MKDTKKGKKSGNNSRLKNKNSSLFQKKVTKETEDRPSNKIKNQFRDLVSGFYDLGDPTFCGLINRTARAIRKKENIEKERVDQ